MFSAVLLAMMLGLRLDDVDENLVEALRDAQTTNRDAWSRGRARVRLTVTTPDAANPCVVTGEILWHDDSFILKTQVADPDDIYFAQSRQFDEEGNFIARGQGFFITYSAGQNGLRNQDWAPRTSSFAPIFVLSPRVRFGYCCPPHSDPGRPWKDLIGPSPNLPDVFKTSKFTHRTASRRRYRASKARRGGKQGRHRVLRQIRHGGRLRGLARPPRHPLATERLYLYEEGRSGTAAGEMCRRFA